MPNLQQVVAYIRQYQAKFPVAALREQLVKQGVPAAVVDQAIQIVKSPGTVPGQPLPGTGPAAQPATQPPRPAPGAPPPGQGPRTLLPGSVPPGPATQPPRPAPGAPLPGQGPRTLLPGSVPPGPATQPPRPAPGAPPPSAGGPPPPAGSVVAPSLLSQMEGPVSKPPAGRTYILIVDDDPLIRDMLVAKLESAGYRVTCAEDAAQSVIQAEGMRLSLIISDIEMPGFGTGVDALKKLRASNQVRKNLPVIFVTGMPPQEARKIVPKTDPFVRLLHKPVDWRLLQQYIRELTGMDKSLM